MGIYSEYSYSYSEPFYIQMGGGEAGCERSEQKFFRVFTEGNSDFCLLKVTMVITISMHLLYYLPRSGLSVCLSVCLSVLSCFILSPIYKTVEEDSSHSIVSPPYCFTSLYALIVLPPSLPLCTYCVTSFYCFTSLLFLRSSLFHPH